MRLAQILVNGQPRLARKTARGLAVLRGLNDMISAICDPAALAACTVETVVPEDAAQFLPAVTRPGKILCVGTNYRRHIEETGSPLPVEPVLFSKFATSLSAHRQPVVIPDCAKHMDYEAELVLVVGRGGKNLSREEALASLFGCTCGNDVSARDLQTLSSQWLLGKAADGFAPVGPYVVTMDEIPDIQNLSLECRLNGELRQSSNTSDMIFDCAEILRYITRTMTLEPGDLIFTGTPDGVILGYPESERVWLRPGDVAEVTVGSVGTLVTPFG